MPSQATCRRKHDCNLAYPICVHSRAIRTLVSVGAVLCLSIGATWWRVLWNAVCVVSWSAARAVPW